MALEVRCRIELLGDLRVVQGEQVHTRFRTRKAAHLVAYLALRPQQAQPRERLVELFWGDREEAAGRDGLSTALAQLRRQLEGEEIPVGSLFLADKQQVRLNPLAVSTDVAEFDHLLDHARQSADKQERADLLQQAVKLYRGDLLPDCYDEWATVEQTRCRVLYQESLMRLALLWEEAGRYAEALAMAQRACAADPFAEEGYRTQMRLLVRLKKPAAALQLYESLEQLFRKELGARPSASTRQMAEMIRQDPQAALLIRAETALPAPASVPPEAAEEDAPPPSLPAPTPANAPILPLQLTRFFGREQEREQIADLLKTPGTRLVSLLGPGGTGKTRLSLEVAAQVAPAFLNRVWFVALADIPDASLIVSTLVHALRPPPDAQADPLERIVAHLGETPCLLVLDNLEHLLRTSPPAYQMGKYDNPAMSGVVGLIRVLLQRVPALVCLVTSRQALQVGGEQVFPLPPLPLPADATPLETLRSNDSIALYLDRARAARPDFAMTEHNAAAIAAICRRLEGMPLALEMAAAWVKTIPPQKMLERLEHQLDLLVSRRRDLPPRHQSLRATIEWSYDLLTADLRRLFARLSVFRGGWTLEAAEAVCGDEALHGLIALQEHSLVIAIEEEDAPRYRMLEPLREYAAEKLAEMGDTDPCRDAHAAYYEEFAREASHHYNDDQLKNWLNQMDADWDNLRSTFAWCREHNPEIGLRLTSHLPVFLQMRGHVTEGCRWMEEALAYPQAMASTPLRASVLEGVAYLLLIQGELGKAQTYAEESAQIWRSQENHRKRVAILNLLAMIACDTGDPNRACELWYEMLPLARDAGLKQYEAVALHNLGETLMDLGQVGQARSLLEDSLTQLRSSQDTEKISRALNTLGKALLRLGDDSALACILESLELRIEIDDRSGLIETLETIVEVMATQDHAAEAVQLASAMQVLRHQTTGPRPANEETQFARSLERAREHLTPADFTAAWSLGESMTREQAIDYGRHYAAAHSPLP